MSRSPIRALIVADAVTSRRLLSQALSSETGMEVVGTAANERIALSKLSLLRPDVVTVSPELPEDGTAHLISAIRNTHPRLPLVIFSAFSPLSAGRTRTLMALGGSACISAASNSDEQAATRMIREALIPKIKALCCRVPEKPQRIEVVAIGISTGGPNALPVILSALPPDFAVPILIVQHMPPVFTRQLAERLDCKCAFRVREAEAGALLQKGDVWLAPGDQHLTISSEGGLIRLGLNRDEPENSCRPSVDPLFRSVAATYGSRSLVVVMTGMGRDGLKGCEAIRETGGQILVQDEASSVVWGMPGSVVRAGLADAVLPLDQLAAEILRRVSFFRSSRSTQALHGS